MKPYFSLNKAKVHQQYVKIRDLCDYASYSFKTNPIVGKVLEEESGCMFSVHMVNEMKKIKDHSRILFLAQAWSELLVRDLVHQGVKWFAVDNEADLDTFLEYVDKHTKDPLNLLLRLRLKENTLRTEKFFVFGMSSDVINARIKKLRDHPKIGKLGVHFHRKTQNMAEWNYTYEIEHALKQETLMALDLINMGGGLPSDYANTNVKVINGIIEKIKAFRTWLKDYGIQLMLEPGRFIAASAVKLHTTIVGKHGNNLIVNASVYNTDMDALIVPVKLLVEGEVGKDEGEPFVVKGITPCSLDLFRYRVYLKNPQIGDELVFLKAGAYNFTTEFCELDKLETKIE